MSALLRNGQQRKLKTVPASRVRWMQMPQMLTLLGFAPKEVYWNSNIAGRTLRPIHRAYRTARFWERPTEQIESILARVRDKYREAIKQHHPDAGGSVESATLVIAIYKRIQRLAAKRGYEV